MDFLSSEGNLAEIRTVGLKKFLYESGQSVILQLGQNTTEAKRQNTKRQNAKVTYKKTEYKYDKMQNDKMQI